MVSLTPLFPTKVQYSPPISGNRNSSGPNNTQTDGQTEHLNQILSKTFVYTVTTNKKIDMVCFLLLNSYLDISPGCPANANINTNTNINVPAASELAKRIYYLHKQLTENIKLVQALQAQYYKTA
jgi:hypothetical protein